MTSPKPTAPLAVGFDLDMTLIDTVPGFAPTLTALGLELEVDFDVEAMTSRLGPPLDVMLDGMVEPERIPQAVDRFRELYVDHAIAPVPALPGAEEAIAAVRAHGGRVVIVTGKYTPNAQRHLDHLELDHDLLAGEVYSTGKSAALEAEGCSIYVGDHVHDVEGALAAGALSVSVLTGGCTEAELLEAGTHVVLADLGEFPAWLDEHVLALRTETLLADLTARGSVVVAYSGGADSALLLAAAVRAVGAENVVAATGYSHSLPLSERDPARDFAQSLGVRIETPQTNEIDREGYRANGADRCFFCKSELIEVLTPLAAELGIGHVATGTNADDLVAGFRPGIRAAAERGAITPLADAGFTKAQVRELSRRWDLPTWDKPAAACLSSRIKYGVEVTPYRLARVERAESAVRAVAAAHEVPLVNLRVRDLGERARIELDARLLPMDLSLQQSLVTAVQAAGFAEAELDPKGFRSGSMNEGLTR